MGNYNYKFTNKSPKINDVDVIPKGIILPELLFVGSQ